MVPDVNDLASILIKSVSVIPSKNDIIFPWPPFPRASIIEMLTEQVSILLEGTLAMNLSDHMHSEYDSASDDAFINLEARVLIKFSAKLIWAYNSDSSTVSGSDESELATVKNNYLIKKLGLKDGPELDKAIASVMDTYGQSNRNKYRAVVYYLLCKHFNKASVY